MWTPRSFRVDDVPRLHELIRSNPFGLLLSAHERRVTGTHLPFMIDEDGSRGTLVGHMARANSHWKSWSTDTEVLSVFSGPHAYVSPGWYRDRITVPTWNYAAVHAYGRPRIVTDTDELRAMVERLTALYEPATGGWHVEEGEPVMGTELKAIVGFTIPIERLEGKFKFNQNRTLDDQRGVVEALRNSPDDAERSVAEIMQEDLERCGNRDEEGRKRA